MGQPVSADLVGQVLCALKQTLASAPADLAETAYLPDLPGFDSLAIADLLETLEDALQVEVAPERLLPEAFETPRAIADLFAQSLGNRDLLPPDTRERGPRW